MKNYKFWKGTLYCVLAALAWAFIGPVSRICFAEGMDPVTVSFWRMAISGTCFLIHALLRREVHFSCRDLGVMIPFGIINVSLVILSLQIAIQKSGGALAIILMFTAPAWVALFSRIFFNEIISTSKILAMTLAMAGTSFVCLSGGSLGKEVSYIGLGCGLLSGFTYALQFIFFTYYKDKYSTAALFAMTFIPAAMVLAIGTEFSSMNWKTVCAILMLSVFSTYIAYYWYGQSLRFLSPVQAAIIGNLEPVVSTLLCWWLWQENFSSVGWTGCILVLISVLVLTIKR
jgi:drug/metabolite transporter (DMT)-like permease